VTPLARRTRRLVYRALAAGGAAPPVTALAAALCADVTAVHIAMAELSAARAVVLDGDGELEWALPFSAVRTPYRVISGRRGWHAPCAWDALAIAPLLGVDTTVLASCPDCGEALRVAVTPTTAALLDVPRPEAAVVHFAQPAARWWDDIREA